MVPEEAGVHEILRAARHRVEIQPPVLVRPVRGQRHAQDAVHQLETVAGDAVRAEIRERVHCFVGNEPGGASAQIVHHNRVHLAVSHVNERFVTPAVAYIDRWGDEDGAVLIFGGGKFVFHDELVLKGRNS